MSTEMPAFLSHVAFIMDGNRRWAKMRGMNPSEGHKKGAKVIEPVALKCKEMGIKYASFYTVSIDNLQRPAVEVNALFQVLRQHAGSLLDYLANNEISFRAIGDLSLFPNDLQDLFLEAEAKSPSTPEMTVNLALGYNGANEIARAVRQMIKDGVIEGKVTDKLIYDYLDTKGQPNPDLIIRTGDHARLSGFLPLQSIYAEIYFSHSLWPDFTPLELLAILEWYRSQTRTFGK